jgi:hypothetical protein
LSTLPPLEAETSPTATAASARLGTGEEARDDEAEANGDDEDDEEEEDGVSSLISAEPSEVRPVGDGSAPPLHCAVHRVG